MFLDLTLVMLHSKNLVEKHRKKKIFFMNIELNRKKKVNVVFVTRVKNRFLKVLQKQIVAKINHEVMYRDLFDFAVDLSSKRDENASRLYTRKEISGFEN